MQKYLKLTLLLVLLILVLAVFQLPDGNLHIIACDVGQGDGILITYRNIQILTDGGPNNKVIDCLSEYLPFYDREIELVILTHPQADHYTGLIEVFRRYKVNNFLYNKLDVSSDGYKVLEKEVGSSGANAIIPKVPLGIRLGLIYLDIVNPYEGFASQELNDYSITYYLTFKDFKAILTGDLSPEISEAIINKNLVKQVNYIKIPHHGSKNGLTENLLKALDPSIAVISVGKDSRYGHPHKEILDM